MSESRISLRLLTSADLPLIRPWFEEPDTSRFLGGPEWPAQLLALAERSAGTMFRGARRIDSHQYLALADGAPAGYIDCGTFDRCTVYGGEGPDGPIILETIDAVTGGDRVRNRPRAAWPRARSGDDRRDARPAGASRRGAVRSGRRTAEHSIAPLS
jgi:hypothetical protein